MRSTFPPEITISEMRVAWTLAMTTRGRPSVEDRFSGVEVAAPSYQPDAYQLSNGLGRNPRTRTFAELLIDAEEDPTCGRCSSGCCGMRDATGCIMNRQG